MQTGINVLQVVERVVSPNPLVDTVKSNDSDKTLSGSSDSIGTAYRLDSQDSTTSVEGRRGLLPNRIRISGPASNPDPSHWSVPGRKIV